MPMSALTSGRLSLRYFTGFGIATCVPWVAIYFALQTVQTSLVASATLDGRNLARSLAEHVEATVRVIDLSLLTLREEWHNGPQAFAAAAPLQQEFLKRESITHIGVADANGVAVWDSTPGWKPVDISDREYFRFHRKRDADDQLHISEPLQGRISGQSTIQFTRPIYDHQRRFAGVLTLSVPPPALEKVYMDIKPGEGGNISLVRSDGTFLARSRNYIAAIDHPLPQLTTPGLSLHESGGELTLSVRDNGIGFDVAAILDSRGNRGLGLLAIEQRARRLGGRMAALSSPGAGTQIDVVFPLQTAAA